jgi:hypothetical protein
MADTLLNLVPDEVDLELLQGDDIPIEFQILTVNDAGAVVPIDISNDTIKFTARDFKGGAVTIATKSNVPGQHIDPATGKTTFILTATDTKVIGQEGSRVKWVYEVRRVDGATGRQTTHFQGKLILDGMVGTQ